MKILTNSFSFSNYENLKIRFFSSLFSKRIFVSNRENIYKKYFHSALFPLFITLYACFVLFFVFWGFLGFFLIFCMLLFCMIRTDENEAISTRNYDKGMTRARREKENRLSRLYVECNIFQLSSIISRISKSF